MRSMLDFFSAASQLGGEHGPYRNRFTEQIKDGCSVVSKKPKRSFLYPQFSKPTVGQVGGWLVLFR